MSASRHQNHAASPYADGVLVRCAFRGKRTWRRRIHRIPRPTCRDDRDTPLWWARDTRMPKSDLPDGEREKFLRKGLDTESRKARKRFARDGQIIHNPRNARGPRLLLLSVRSAIRFHSSSARTIAAPCKRFKFAKAWQIFHAANWGAPPAARFQCFTHPS
jgi:hypothetical protein